MMQAMPYLNCANPKNKPLPEFKKHGDVLAETKSKQDAIQNDITGLVQAIQES